MKPHPDTTRSRLVNRELTERLLTFFADAPPQGWTFAEVFERLQLPDGDPDTRRTLWQLLDGGQLELTLDRRLRRRGRTRSGG